jgi:transcriptional regulator with XRE-family HTH domain
MQVENAWRSINRTDIDFIGHLWYLCDMDKQLKITALRIAASVRSLREEKGLTIGALARQTRLSKSTISSIEAGTANPSLEVLWRLTQALGVPLGALLGAEARPAPRVIRAGEGTVVASESGARLRLLLAEARQHRTEVYELSFLKGEGYVSAAHAMGTEEFLLCLEGHLEVGPLEQEAHLGPGDALWFVADQPHCYRSTEGARALALMLYPAVMQFRSDLEPTSIEDDLE